MSGFICETTKICESANETRWRSTSSPVSALRQKLFCIQVGPIWFDVSVSVAVISAMFARCVREGLANCSSIQPE